MSTLTGKLSNRSNKPSAEIYQGLTTKEAKRLQEEGKGNAPPKSAGRTVGQILLGNLFTWFNILNLLLALALVAVRSYRNMLFMGVVVFNTLISTVQEVRAKRTVDKLTLLVQAPVPVLRDGVWGELPPEQLVLGDVVRFSAGDQVCADAQVLDGLGAANESLLTGESDALLKTRGDALLSGSTITEGRLFARLTQVGEMSYASQLVQSARRKKAARSRLMEDLKKLIRFISVFLLPVGILLFAKQYWLLKNPLHTAIPTTVAAMIGMIPEGLMLLTSMALAVGVIRLGKQDTLVQELYGIENLARVDTLCVDKTGTITKGCLKVEEVLPLDGRGQEDISTQLRRLLQASEDDNLTFQALRGHFTQALPADTVTARVPFSSARKWSSVTFAMHGTLLIGAPEFVLPDMPPALQEMVNTHAQRGLRVLLLAHSSKAPENQVLPSGIQPLALITLHDEIREDFAQTVAFLNREDVQVKVISGDNPRTVAEVARRAGLTGAEKWADASAFASDEELAQAADKYMVLGRVAPEQKKKLILALKQRGHTVAMVGDGVNDVPALKSCDCAIAMAGGSDAARKVSQVTLMRENFSALPAIILEGRRVINNMTRSASLFLVKTCFSYLLALITLFLPWPYPFSPIQLTLISTFTVGVPSFFLALEPNKERVKTGFLQTILTNALPGAVTNVVLVLLLFVLSDVLQLPPAQRSTIAVGALGATGLMVLLQTSRPLTPLRLGLLAVMAAGLILTALLFGRFFLLVPLPGKELTLMLGLMAISPLLYRALRGALPRIGAKLFAKLSPDSL